MSNESTASETTPLRRPESQNSEDVSTPPFTNAVTHDSRTNTIQRQPPNSATTTANLQVVAKATRHNNNHTEVLLCNNLNNININNNNSSTSLEMQTKRVLCRIGLDVLVLACVGLPILCFFLWGDSYKRGFFCDDESLKHPFKESTVKSWMLYIIGLVLPVGVMLAVEIIKSKDNERHSNGNATARRYAFMDYEIPDWLVECYKKIGIFGFGAAVSQLTTDIAKYSIGRLRPHFFAVCQPIMADGTTCSDAINSGRYIQDFTCRGIGSTPRMIKEVRLSFPSGHSSFTFYTMVYLALYLQSRMTWRGSKLLCHFLQFTFIMIAWFTALSRVSDYKHHWSDVLAGSTIGALVAVIVANYVSDLFVQQSKKSYVLPHTTQDMQPPQMITPNGH